MEKAVTLDLMFNSPSLYKEVKSNFLGESCSLSDVTKGLFPSTPSNMHFSHRKSLEGILRSILLYLAQYYKKIETQTSYVQNYT